MKRLLAALGVVAAGAGLAGCGASPGSPNDTVWVDADSRGGPCDDDRSLATVSRTAPVCSLDRAAALVPDGGVVVVRGGTYPRLTVTAAGTRLTTWRGYEDERPSLEGILALAGSARQRFEGFAVRDVTQLLGTRLQLASSDLTPHGVILQGADNLVEDNDIHDLTMRFDPELGPGEQRCNSFWRLERDGGDNPDADGDGVGDVPLTTTGAVFPWCGTALRVKGDRNVIRGNRLRAIPADGIQASVTTDLLVEGNTFADVEPSVDPLEHSDAVQLIGTNTRATVRRNVFRNSRGILASAQVTRTTPAVTTYPEDVTIARNLFVNERDVLHVGNSCMSIAAGTYRIAGNTCWTAPGVNPHGGIRLVRQNPPRGPLAADVRGNITAEMRIGPGAELVEDHDLVGRYVRLPGATFTPGPHSLVATAEFVDGDPALGLAPGSPGVDAGDRGAVGAAADLGCRAPAGAGALVDLGAVEAGGPAGSCPWTRP